MKRVSPDYFGSFPRNVVSLANGSWIVWGAALVLFIGCATPPQPDRTAKVSPAAAPIAAATSTNTPAADPRAVEAFFPIGEAKALFNSFSMSGWRITPFAGHGDIRLERSFQGAPALIFEQGEALTGVTWTNAIPQMNYEITLEASKLLGGDFFCGLTFPVESSHCTFVVGGWGGATVGISSVDGEDASMNETTQFMKFDLNRWYRFRVRVIPGKIEAWIDSEQVVNLDTTGKRISMRLGEIEESIPFGLAAWQTRTAIRDVRVRRLPEVKFP
jgi:hypothetical protein